MNGVDNRKYYNDSLSYDFSLFMPSPSKDSTARKIDTVSRTNKSKKSNRIKIKVNKKSQKKAKKYAFFSVLCIGICFALVIFNLVIRIKENETNDKINNLQQKIKENSAEYTSLKCKYENMFSFDNLEVYASELGMTRPKKGQIKYIKINEQEENYE